MAAKARTWIAALLPLALLGGFLALSLSYGVIDIMQGEGVPPVERLTYQRVTLAPGVITATILNDGPDDIAIAQVQVDDAFWTFTANNGTALRHLARTTLTIPYPWVAGEAHVVRVLTSTGTPFDHEIAVAVETSPYRFGRFLFVFTLIGLFVGVVPVAIGLMWFPSLAGLTDRGMDFLLALTIGLLGFLMIDGTLEGLEAAQMLPASFQGGVLFAAAAVGAYLLLEGVGAWLKRRRTAGGDGWVLSLMIAVGIGLHNFGEGLAIASAFVLGEGALGTLLIIGFALHNVTEGLAIVAPLARERKAVAVKDLLKLGLIGGVPTIAGALIGGAVYSPVWSVLFLGIGVGAIAQVVGQISRQVGRERTSQRFASGPVMAGLVAGFAVMYVTGMLVG
jgi:hypothetical protein